MSDAGYRESDIGLPPLFTLRGFEGSLGEYVEQLYWQYRAMVYDPGIRLWGKPVVVPEGLEADGRDRLFWHLITDGKGGHTGGRQKRRKLSLIRCSRLPWVWDILERLDHGDPRACWWRSTRGRLMIAPVDFRMLICLNIKPGSYCLETAYPLGRKQRGSHMARAAAAWESGACVLPAVKRRRVPGPYHSPDAIERHRCWM